MNSVLLISVFLMMTYGPVYAQRMLPTNPGAIFYNGKVVTIDPEYHVSEAFAVRNGLFLAVGSSAEVQALAGPFSLDDRLVTSKSLKLFNILPGVINSIKVL